MAKIIGLQRMETPALLPFNDEDYEFVSSLRTNQIIEVKPLLSKNALKQRSYMQLCLLMAALRVVVANSENANWDTIARAKLSLKVLLNFIDESAVVFDQATGRSVFQYRSFGYDDLKHLEACKVFDRAFIVLADQLGISVDELVENAMTGNYSKNLP